MSRSNQMKSMMSGAMLLTFASLIGKFLSAIYKVPLQNWTGDAGFYAYQQVYPLYGIADTLALTTIPVFVSKVLSDYDSSKNRLDLLRRLRRLLLLFFWLIFALVFLLADHLASWMGDPGLNQAIRSVSIFFLLVPLLGLYRGYFQAQLNMKPTAISQLLEQVVRVAIILLVAWLYLKSDWSVHFMAASALSSSWIAGLLALLFLASYAYKNKAVLNSIEDSRPLISYRDLGKLFLSQGLIMGAFGSLLLIFQLIDSFTVFNGLLAGGMEKTLAMQAKGIYDRGQPLAQLGLVVTAGLTTSMVPLIRRHYSRGLQLNFTRTAASSLRITFLISGAATIGLIVLLPYFNHFLFEDFEGLLPISIYLLSVLFMSMVNAGQAILQAMDRYRESFIALVASILFKALLNYPAVTQWGTLGSSLVTVLALSLSLVFLTFYLPGPIKDFFLADRFFGKSLLAFLVLFLSVGLNLFILGLVLPGPSRLTSFLMVVLSVLVGVLAFLLVVWRLKILSLREWASLPYSDKIWFLVKKEK